MSRPERADLNSIIQSPEAGVFLGMVTKGFYERSYMGLWIFEIIGREWDEMKSWAKGMKDEIHPQTCTWSIPIWEWLYEIPTDRSLPLEYRRQRVMAKIIAIKPVNPETIRKGVAALIGAANDAVEVDERAGPYRFDVIIHPTGAPFPYNRIAPYIREIKPSHLRFEAAVEARVDIKIGIDTRWNLLGFGLTGQYNAGTHPGINIQARFSDLAVTIEETATGTAFMPQLGGTAYAAQGVDGKQRMPVPSTLFAQGSAGITVEAEADGYAFSVPMPGLENSETGRYPDTRVKGGVTDINVGNIISGAGAGFTPQAAGMKPYPQRLFEDGGIARIAAEIGSERYATAPEPTGTNPGTSVKLKLESVDVETDIGTQGYKANFTAAKKQDSQTGRHPGHQQAFAKGSGGITPSIETESYTVSFRLCGTTVTK